MYVIGSLYRGDIQSVRKIIRTHINYDVCQEAKPRICSSNTIISAAVCVTNTLRLCQETYLSAENDKYHRWRKSNLDTRGTPWWLVTISPYRCPFNVRIEKVLRKQSLHVGKNSLSFIEDVYQWKRKSKRKTNPLAPPSALAELYFLMQTTFKIHDPKGPEKPYMTANRLL